MSSSSEQARWFAEEVRPHEPVLRGYLQNRFPSLPDHDDIVQEAYARVLRAAGNGPLACAKGFLFTVARNVAIDMLRRQQAHTHEPLSDLAEMPVLDDAPTVVESLEHQQRMETLLEAIGSLPERCREVILLRHVDGLAYKEIATRLGISPNTVRLHIVRGRRDCAAFFEKHGLLEEPAATSAHDPT